MATDPRAALVCDVLDGLGLPEQALGADIVPVQRGQRFVGPAFTVQAVEVDEPGESRYRGLLAALDAVGSGQVFVMASGRTEACAMWGELLSNVCVARGVIGTVTDGFIRDAALIRELGYPVFARGTLPLDIHGRCEVLGHGEPVQIDGVQVSRGDVIVADEDGVAVVPADLAERVMALATEKALGEDQFRSSVANGMGPIEAFRRFNVL